MKALIDGDIIVYSCGFAGEHKTYTVTSDNAFEKKKEALSFCESYSIDPSTITVSTSVEPLENILHSVKLLIQSILSETGSEDFEVFLTGEGNYRDKLATIRQYKGNRDPDHKPMYYNEIKEYLLKHWGAVVVEGREADDAMGCEQYGDYEVTVDLNSGGGEGWDRTTVQEEVDTIICTIDKDLNMIPGWHYNWRKREKYWVDDAEANKFFYKQLLMGDVTDNIQGIPKVGPKTADRILDSKASEVAMYLEVQSEYERYYKKDWAKYLEENANLLWIQREENVLWQPPV